MGARGRASSKLVSGRLVSKYYDQASGHDTTVLGGWHFNLITLWRVNVWDIGVRRGG